MLQRYVLTTVLALAAVPGPAVADAQEVAGKAVSISQPWARATPGGATIGAAYVDISGLAGGNGDKLLGASSPAAGRVEVHTHLMEDGVMKMRKVDSVTILPGKTLNLAPGGEHLMLFDLKTPLKQGNSIPLTLKFEVSGDISLSAIISTVGATEAPGASKAAANPNADAKLGMDGPEAGSHEGSHAGSHEGN
jgi:periplasmic copper chaperone A